MGKVPRRVVPLGRLAIGSSIIQRMNQEDMYLGHKEDHNTSSVGSPNCASSRLLG
jgi:hypothetical protein